MTAHRSHRIVALLLQVLRQHDALCTRSELAGMAQLTIRQLSEELEYLVELGAVDRVEDEHTTRYKLRDIGIRPPRSAPWRTSFSG